MKIEGQNGDGRPSRAENQDSVHDDSWIKVDRDQNAKHGIWMKEESERTSNQTIQSTRGSAHTKINVKDENITAALENVRGSVQVNSDNGLDERKVSSIPAATNDCVDLEIKCEKRDHDSHYRNRSNLASLRQYIQSDDRTSCEAPLRVHSRGSDENDEHIFEGRKVSGQKQKRSSVSQSGSEAGGVKIAMPNPDDSPYEEDSSDDEDSIDGRLSSAHRQARLASYDGEYHL